MIKDLAIIERTKQRIDCLRVDDVLVVSVENEDKKLIQKVTVSLGGDYNK